MQVGFQRFLNLGNPWKPPKTRELGNLDTHVPFPGNLTNIYAVGTVETYRNLRNLLKKNVTKKFRRISMYVKRKKNDYLGTHHPEENLRYSSIRRGCGEDNDAK